MERRATERVSDSASPFRASWSKRMEERSGPKTILREALFSSCFSRAPLSRRNPSRRPLRNSHKEAQESQKDFVLFVLFCGYSLLLPYPERRVIAYRVDNFQIDAGKMADLVERLVVGNAKDTSASLCGIRQFFGRENSPHMIGAVILQADNKALHE